MSPVETLEIHSHSTASDGTYEPQKLAELMADRQVDLWALTDHDTLAGCAEARRAASQLGIAFVAGIEISADLDGTSIHVLGYGLDETERGLSDYAKKMKEGRRQRMSRMVKRMCDLGHPVTLEEVIDQSGGGNLGRPHLAKALLARGYVDRLQKAFDRWLATDRPGYVPMSRPDVSEAVEMIVDAGGFAVLAHPGRYGDISDHLDRWRDRGLWGLEVRHPSHDGATERELLHLAARYDLGMTASNDWHGHKEGAFERLGKVRFPDSWRFPFLEKLEDSQ